MRQFTQPSHANVGQGFVGGPPAEDRVLVGGGGESQDWRRAGKNTNLHVQNILNRLISVITVHCCCVTSCKGSERIWGRLGSAFVISSWKLSGFWAPSGTVIYYNYMVPEGERHDTAIKRNREVLSAEIKLWEGYLDEVKNSTFAQTTEQ